MLLFIKLDDLLNKNWSDNLSSLAISHLISHQKLLFGPWPR